ncbi:Plasma membrane permease, mediates uptake of glycerophosphoinositol and glycerophosphocholine [Apophysomyces sp. BC1034]|nr:Plasma membrane permease, mediates uptake of glycerophosphoinositol and glycerophosphocholine [Apophysomyces sp. BC1015]KAG0178662.1 Plasma membrane permease, mediates uptake of glycerophosphoinositol and glycerophosphocholine [Apophysomyces sp. BC1021]KAG0189106.1 Plasma membrane permease, mediates uptake of glycerophosphoinositol and glycerophosphocholine [Apophysomyces sp. BC1034]
MDSQGSNSPSSNSKVAVYENDVDHIIRKSIDEQASSSNSVSTQTTTKKKSTASIFNVIFSGFALLSDGYQSGVITFVNLFLTRIYGADVLNDTMLSRLSYAMFVGAVVGQLGFGLIIDRIGRKVGLIATTALVIIGAALSCASSGTTTTGLLWMMIIARGVIGVGVGGEYPCSSVSAGESADEFAPGKRGTIFIFVTNFVIDVGYVISAIVPVILLAIFKDNLEPVWRLCLGLGILPPLSVLYFRLKMADSKAYTAGAIKRKVPYLLILKRYWPRILITSGLWFVYDFIAYPNGVFSSIIISTVAKSDSLIITVSWNILLYAFYLPGSAGGALSVDKIGRRKTLTFGLIAQGIVGLIIGGVYVLLTENCFPMFIIMYGLFLALGEFAGDCMGLNAMELFPTAIRGTCYGIASAFGKVGATVGTLAFIPMQQSMGGVRGPFLVGSGIAIVAGIIAWFFLPDIGPEGLVEEDEAFRVYLADNGYDVSQMGHATPKALTSPE